LHAGAAHRQFLRAAAQAQPKPAGSVAPGDGQVVEVDDGDAVYLAELRRVQTGQQVGDRRADQVFRGGGAHHGARVVSLEVQHLGNRHRECLEL
jgi:hypothetical protein